MARCNIENARLQSAGNSLSALLIRRKAMDGKLLISGCLQPCLVSILYKHANIINKHRPACCVRTVGLKASAYADLERSEHGCW